MNLKSTALVGALYGVALGAVAFLAVGAGHGTYFPLLVSSAPLGALGVGAAMAGAPLLWATLGWILDGQNTRSRRRIALLVIIIHYTVALLLLKVDQYGDWEYASRNAAVWGLLGVWFLLYAGGQVVVWRFVLGKPSN